MKNSEVQSNVSLQDSGIQPESSIKHDVSILDIPAIKPPFDPALLVHVQHCVERLEKKKLNILSTEKERRKAAYALINDLGEMGRDLFHRISRFSDEYSKEEADQYYTHKTESRIADGNRITLGTLFMMLKDAGISIRKKQDPAINSGKVNSKAFRIIKEKYSITKDTLIQEIYVNGKILDDTVLNTIMIELLIEHDINVKKDFILSAIECDFTEESNRFIDLINRHIERKPYGTIDKLADCIITKTGEGLGLSFDYKRTILKHIFVKWIAQQYESDIPHDLCLVLLGGKHVGKTHFFKHLLPAELRDLRKITPFKNDKDFKRDTTRYLLIIDDELRGRRISDNEFIKSILSTTDISLRLPYGKKDGHFKRIAMFCGTGNERFILKDVTGNRRMVAFWVDKIDRDLYNSINKIDLIMEAFHLYRDGYVHELSDQMLDAIDLVSKEFEVSTTAEELLTQFLPPIQEETDTSFWWNGHRIRQTLKDEHHAHLTDYELHQALRKLNYRHEYKKVGNSKLLCWLMHRQTFEGMGAGGYITTLPVLPNG